MNGSFSTVIRAGQSVRLPSETVGDRTLVIQGRWLRTAVVESERFLPSGALEDPEALVAKLKESPWKPDVFTFSQKPPDVEPKHAYPYEMDNLAVIDLKDGFSDWWDKRLPQEARKNARRAAKRGVVTRTVDFSDDLIKGIVEINNETAIRQGRPFYHFGKTFDEVKKAYSSFPDRSQFVGAYYEDELIGFIQIIYLGRVASILAFLVKNRHSDKRPANALILKAVEVCVEKGITHVIFGKFVYGANADSPMTEFKRRIGFQQVLVPQYYVPLTWKGSLAIRLRLHLGWRRMIPTRIYSLLANVRSMFYKMRGLGPRKEASSA